MSLKFGTTPKNEVPSLISKEHLRYWFQYKP